MRRGEEACTDRGRHGDGRLTGCLNVAHSASSPPSSGRLVMSSLLFGNQMSAKYIFIDGGFLRQARIDAFQRLFGKGIDGQLDCSRLKDAIGGQKAFYYDCAGGELAQKELERIHESEGFHVFSGTLIETPKRRGQKEVDVALAVDMLMHAHAKNMDQAALITGDLDFRPVVDALVRLGVYVTLWTVRPHSAENLRYAADHVKEMDDLTLYEWATQSFRELHPVPRWPRGKVRRLLGKTC